MMIREALVVEAVVPFGPDSTSFRISLCGDEDVHASSLLRLGRLPASATDVVDAQGELVARTGLICSRWELRRRRDDALVAEGTVAPIAVQPLAPLPCLVRLFGSG